MIRPRRKHLASPSFLGLPDRFKRFHPHQERGVFDVVESDKPTRILCAPTGWGKTILPATIAAITGQRVLILVATKLLEDQYVDVLASMGLRDVRGAANYPCPALVHGEFGWLSYSVRSKPTADHGPCRLGIACSLRGGGCPRFDAIRDAKRADIVVSNYAYWLSIGKRLLDDKEDETLGDFDWIFLDEIHLADSEICRAVTSELDLDHLRAFHIDVRPPETTNFIDEWRGFARDTRVRVGAKYDELKSWLRVEGDSDGGVIHELKTLRTLDRSLEQIASSSGRLVIERRGSRVKIQPVWAGPYFESLLRRGVPNLVGMSATVTPSTMRYLDIAPADYDFFEYPSTFPTRNGPVYFMPSVRMHYEMGERDLRMCVATIDNILRSRDDRRTLVQSVSYGRARQIAGGSRCASRMITHDGSPGASMKALDYWLGGPEDGVLVSPSFSTGVDLPYRACEVGIEPKTPYPPKEDVVMRMRSELDKKYAPHYAATEITQMCGRPWRFPDDMSENFIIDSAFGGLLRQRELFAKSFLTRIRWINTIPPKPPRAPNKWKYEHA